MELLELRKSYQRLIDGNKKYSLEKRYDDPDYFKKLSIGQKPEYLWIGCSDSRVPANEITMTQSGEIFVHRNVANLVHATDLNLMSVVEYAVAVLGVKHIIICGHYGCGGVIAAMGNKSFGSVDSWLRNIKDVYIKYSTILEAIEDKDKRADRLVELNVIEQVKNLARTKTVQKAWNSRELQVHGWVYGLNSGLITDLKVQLDQIEDLEPIYRYEL
jgi:carbonic anhydrase